MISELVEQRWLSRVISVLVVSVTLSSSAYAGDVVYQSLREGKGASPTADDTVKVHYRGTLSDGALFDSSYTRNDPVELKLGNVIPCWTEGLQKMKPGGKARLICPPDTAYGEYGAGIIPPNATLTFEIELIGISGQSDITPAMQQQLDAYARAERAKKEQEEAEIALAQQEADRKAREAKNSESQMTFSKILGGLAKVGDVALSEHQKRIDQKISASIGAQQRAEQSGRDSDTQLLKNWNPVSTSAKNGQPMIEICIRDYSCEDGDILRVSINGMVVMQKEMFNPWYCEKKYVRAGTNSVQVYAVNSTGNPNVCPVPIPVNTGQIRLNGINSDGSTRAGQIQEWKLKAGAGSTSSVEISVE